MILLLVFFDTAKKRRTFQTPLESTQVIRTVNPEGTFRRKIDKTQLLWANDEDLRKTPACCHLAYMSDKLKYSLNSKAEFPLLYD